MSAYEAAGETDEWYTPAHVFEAMGVIFDMDVASPSGDCPADNWCRVVVAHDSLSRDWTGFVWMNPPFGHQATKRAWLKKFFDHANGVALTPDRTSAPWFREAWARADLVLFTPKIKFIRPDGSIGVSPGTGTALWAAGERGCGALRTAAANGLGVLGQPLKLAA